MAEAAAILDAHRIMVTSTVRPDGWPQTTIVGYANEDHVARTAPIRRATDWSAGS